MDLPYVRELRDDILQAMAGCDEAWCTESTELTDDDDDDDDGSDSTRCKQRIHTHIHGDKAAAGAL